MPDPSESPPATERTDVESAGPLDPTLVRPDGNFALSALNPSQAIPFGPPEQDGDLGKLGRYRVLKKLGAGGMGAVYLGSDTLLTRRVALKIMLPQYAADPESRERFLREARAAAVIKSDHVVTIHDVGEERGVPFIAMEYLLGYPLDQFLRVQGNPSLAHVFRIGRETALGLAAAHKLGLVHRDVKPGNIWLEAPKGRVKLLDFGLARTSDDDAHLTTSGFVVGTPAFMSPEQARNQKVDPRSDLFSLGVMLYRLAAGRMPFSGTTTISLLTSLAVDTPTPVRRVKPTVPESLEAVIAKLLAKNPDDRYQTAREVVDALSEAERQKTTVVAVPTEAMMIDAQVDVVLVENDVTGPSQPIVIEPDETELLPERKRSAPKKRRKAPARGPLWPVIAAIVVGLAALVMLATVLLWPSKGTLIVETDDPGAELVIKRDGTVIRERTRDREFRLSTGAYTVELAEPKVGWKLSPERFELTSKAPVRVVIEKKPTPPAPQIPINDADRRGAEWVLSVGGAVHVSGESVEIHVKEKLPRTQFQLHRVKLQDAKPVTDAGLANLKDCKHITVLNLNYCVEVSDAGLAHLKSCPNLLVLSLGRCALVTDVGLANFKGCKKLTRLEIFACPQLTNAGLAHFNGCTELDHMNLGYAYQITDIGMANFSGCNKLTYLNLHGCINVGDAGLVNFKGCSSLVYLNLQGSPKRGDAGLALFNDCKSLRNLFVQYTQVKPQTVADFHRDHPMCRIEHNGGILEGK